MESLRVLFVTDLYEPYVGGVSTHQSELASRLADRGHRVSVVTSRLPGTPKFESSRGVTIERRGFWSVAGRYSITLTGALRVLEISRDVDIIHGNTFTATIPASLTGRISLRPVVVTAYEVFNDLWFALPKMRRLKAGLYRFAERRALKFPVDKFVAISEYTRKRLRSIGIDDARSCTIYCGINYDFWSRSLAKPEEFRLLNGLGNKFVYLFYGRAGLSKGVDILLEAAKIVSSKMPEARLLLCLNPGELYHSLIETITASPKLKHHVVMRTRLAPFELRDAIAAANAVVVPSRSEGFGYSVAESGALGTPVVAADVGAIPEVVSGKHHLVPPRDPRALADAILRGAAGDWELAPDKRFPLDATVTKYEQCFAALLGRAGGGLA